MANEMHNTAKEEAWSDEQRYQLEYLDDTYSDSGTLISATNTDFTVNHHLSEQFEEQWYQLEYLDDTHNDSLTLVSATRPDIAPTQRPTVTEHFYPSVSYGDIHRDNSTLIPARQEADPNERLSPRKQAGFVTFLQTHLHMWALFYFIILTFAEVLTTLINPHLGVILHAVMVLALLLHSGFAWQSPFHRFLIAMILPSLIRVFSLSLPLSAFPLVYWYLASSVPIFVATLLIMRQLDFKHYFFRPRKQHLSLQIFIVLSGVVLGVTEYMILRPQPLIDTFTPLQFVVGASILLFSTGLMEELVFRNVMQVVAIENLGKHFSLLYVSLIFGVLHIGYGSVFDFIFVTLVGYYFSWAVYRTRSIFAVTLAHGLTNIVLFLIAPFIFVQ
jgi:uncharacterized protein